MKPTKKQSYDAMLNACSTAESLVYLTVPCSTRTKATANKAKKLLRDGNFAEALKKADSIAYNVGLSEF